MINVTLSIARIELMMPKVVQAYQSAVGKEASPISAPSPESASVIKSLQEEVNSLRSEVSELRSDNAELAGALEELHREYISLAVAKEGVAAPAAAPGGDESLRTQNEALRSEIRRLHAEIEDIKMSALQAVSNLQRLSGAPLESPLPPPSTSAARTVAPPATPPTPRTQKLAKATVVAPAAAAAAISPATSRRASTRASPSASRRASVKVRQLVRTADESPTGTLETASLFFITINVII